MAKQKKPEDSTLKRHHETEKKMGGSGGRSGRPVTGSGASGGGFIGWLKRLFGG